jgi:beta-galactosidase
MTVKRPADTYLDTRGLHKGQMWVGTHNLGRFWSVGPQYSLYTPGPWLQPGNTTLTFFDLLADSSDHVISVKSPIFGAAVSTREKQ